MKKINVLILGSLILMASMAGAQDRRYVKKLPQGISREAELQCPANSLFSQAPCFGMQYHLRTSQLQMIIQLPDNQLQFDFGDSI